MGMLGNSAGGGTSFNPASPGTPVGYDSYAWASRPDAASYTGRVIRVTDVGPAAGALFISDGTYWVPLNGHVTLFSHHNLNISTTSGTAVELAGFEYVLKAGLFQKPGACLTVSFAAQLTGTKGTGAPEVRMSVGHSPSIWVGSLFTFTSSPAIGAVEVRTFRQDDTFVRKIGASTSSPPDSWPHAPANNGYSEVSFSATSDVPLNFIAKVSDTPGAGETMTVHGVVLSLETP